ncbi:helix-turn-helix domain-containing protein [Enterococcus lactis]|uniref:helix-turn-helix domain-containing protein n=1 Tax=Enterococcus lactis TaxID=357441 RepID=UPI001BD0320D|nr:helix-turn-helix transcriptional regulator [Enterococcus lactis]
MHDYIPLETFNFLLGKKVKELREEKGISQARLAEIAVLHENSIKTIELGKKSPRVYTLYKIAKALDLELECLISQI